MDRIILLLIILVIIKIKIIILNGKIFSDRIKCSRIISNKII